MAFVVMSCELSATTSVLHSAIRRDSSLIRVIRPDRSVDFNTYGALAAVEGVTDNKIIFTYDPERDRPLHGPKPPLV